VPRLQGLVGQGSGSSPIIQVLVRKLWPVLGGFVVLLAVCSAGAGAQAADGGASARAYAIKVAVPGQPVTVAAAADAPPETVNFGASFAYPSEGGAVAGGAITASASAAVGKTSATASASSELDALSLFGGEVSAATVVARVSAQAGPDGASADLSGASVGGLVVLGQAIDAPQPGLRIALADWGYLIVLGQGSAPGDKGDRAFVTSLEVHLTADHGGLSAGTVISVGFAEAAVTAPQASEQGETTITTTTTTAPGQKGAKAGAKGRDSKRGKRLRPPTNLDVHLTPGGYVFPVYGPVSFTDTFGAPRADVSWHHGEDLFAQLGAPVLAVADGTVFSVGWNDLGGNRLWLRDKKGNEFYYAHLSAYSPLAVNGRQVKAGDVLGFVGHTGDAETTPYHLHFEIHPVALLGLGYDGVIAPYRYLLAWRRLEDVRFVPGFAWLPALRPSDAPEPGAYLLSARDISSLSGLDPGSLRRALAPQLSAELP
jgi:murein DD-endopeptidase MepM/ murein hydrolase activator NlpD